nr:uncharacterized protein LOC129446029 isoform X1 [Misgurnus anguillicaudatus]
MTSRCAICNKDYSQLSQHLKVTHAVRNLEERRLLLALESGRVNVRKGRCPVPGCEKEVMRMDRHLQGHSELTAKARRLAFARCKKAKIVAQLAALRATNPPVAMVSTLDLQVEGEQAEGEAPKPPGEEEDDEPQDCGSEACRRRRLRHKRQVADLNAQIDTLSSTLQEVTRRCKKLLRQRGQKPSQRLRGVTKKLLEALQEPEEEQAPLSPPSAFAAGTPGPSSAAPEVPEEDESEMPHFPDHVSALNDFLEEYRKHQEGPNPSRKLKENVGGKIFRIRAFIAFMAAGKSRLSSLEFLNDTDKIRKWVTSLRAIKAAETTVGHYLKNVAQFLDYLSETPPPSSRLSYKAMLAIRHEARCDDAPDWGEAGQGGPADPQEGAS